MSQVYDPNFFGLQAEEDVTSTKQAGRTGTVPAPQAADDPPKETEVAETDAAETDAAQSDDSETDESSEQNIFSTKPAGRTGKVGEGGNAFDPALFDPSAADPSSDGDS